MADRLGQQLGNYQLNRLLGQGGFADVYLGEHVYLKTQAAIKILRTRLASSELDSFLKEARTIATLEHPHIVRVLEFGVQDTIPFLVMTYAPNGTLRERHPRGTRLSLDSILPYVRQVAMALQYAHEQKVIHRDIKPENMLLGRNYDILLSDFGIALIAQSSNSQNLQEMAGTMAYMAPEQLHGKARYASDQYSLGIVVYEWLTGDRPFQGTFTELASQHMFAVPPPLHTKVPGISPEVEQVILTALSKDPQQRFGSMHAFANALEQAGRPNVSLFSGPAILPAPYAQDQKSLPSAPTVAAQANLATPDFSPQKSLHTPIPDPITPIPVITPTQIAAPATLQTKSKLSRRTVVMGLGLGLVGLAGTAGGVYWFTHIPGQTTPRKTTPQGTHIPARVPQGTVFVVYHGHVLPVYSVAWSPDGTRIASGSQDGTVHVWDARTGKRSFRYLGHHASVNAVAWSPDGGRIASASSDLTVHVWDAGQTGDGSSRLAIFKGHTGNLRTLAWSPNGTRIASGADDKTIQVWQSSTGQHLFTYSGHSDQIWSVAWSPDGTRIASGSVDKTAQVWDATSRRTLATFMGHTNEVKSVAWSPDNTRVVSASNDKTVQTWDAASGKHFFTFSGHTDVLNSVAWTPNDKRIVSGSGDYTVRIWDASSATDIFTFSRHELAVHSVVWSPDKQRIASASDDWSVQIWQAV